MNINYTNIRETVKYAPILFLVFITIWLRIANLGYSDYQGEEVDVLSPTSTGQGLIDYLVQQSRGPTQYIVVYLIKLVHPTLSNEFLTRLPFAFAGILAIIFFYKLVKLHFGKKIALYSALFLTTNGLFVGLTRFVQYQSFVILFSILSLYAFTLALKREKWKITGLYAGMISWAVAILSHFDGIFIAPFVAYILYRWYIQHTDLSKLTKIKHLLFSGVLCGLLLLIFYIPFLFSISEKTKEYWSFRLTIKEAKAGFSSSVANFKLYNPLFIIYIYVFLGHLSLFKITKTFPILVWFLLAWETYELLVYDPGTHIYSYLIPATILIAFGVLVIEELVEKILGSRYGKVLNYAGLLLGFIFLASLSHFIFVDHTPEYPWEERRYLFWTVSKPDTEALLWMYGFPYYRHWEEIGDYVTSANGNGYYSSNEKIRISRHYVPHPYDIEESGHYIHIYNPHNFKDKLAKEKIRYWTKNYRPVKSFENDGRVVVEIYEMPPGSIQEIREAGY